MVMENFEQASAESFAFKLMLSLLFARSPEALARLGLIDEEAVRELLGRRAAISKEFIDRTLQTMDAVRVAAAESAQRPG